MGLNQISTLFAFLPLFFSALFLTPERGKKFTLVVFSLLFYTLISGNLVAILLLSAIINYLSALFMSGKARRPVFYLSLFFNIGLLFFYKYLFAFLQLSGEIWGSHLLAKNHAWIVNHTIMPVGISFFTFRAISYLVDVFRGKTSPAIDFAGFLGWFTLFPVIVAGPVVRLQEAYPRILQPSLSFPLMGEGIERFILGLTKKVLIAGSLSYITKLIYGMPTPELSTIMVWLGIIAYFLEIYFDFSGYSDMAIGICLIIGIRIPENFNHPYYALDIRDFWRRWHISLSNWLRDYLFLPAVWFFSRRMPEETYLHIKAEKLIYAIGITITFALCGIWHGASLNFFFWGLYFALFLTLEQLWLGRRLKSYSKPLRRFYTLFVVLIGWLIFRNNSLSTFIIELKKMFIWSEGTLSTESYLRFFLFDLQTIAVLIVGFIFIFPVYPKIKAILHQKFHNLPMLSSGYRIAGILFLGVLFILNISYLLSGSYQPFIYLRF
jgi:alginate O-acetyltransferase complex protein AlgI